MLKDLGIKVLGLLRQCLFWIDSLGFHFIDDAYGFMLQVMAGFDENAVKQIVDNIVQSAYVIVGIFALFKCAVSLINSIVNPEKLGDKKEGFGNILVRVVGAIVLFVVTPILFEQSRFLQRRIVTENYIPRLILGVDIYEECVSNEEYEKCKDKGCKKCSESTNNPGEVFQLVIMKAAIQPNENCKGSLCENAKEAYEDNYVTPITISKFLNEYEKNGEEYEYVYTYSPFILLVAGIFTTYVLISFTIDIAIRSVELLVLEVLSPLFIVTFIDPKMAESGAFKKWVQACIKTYLSLFIKIAIITLMLLFISEVSRTDGLFGDMSNFLKLFMLIAVLIFAKKAPKWLGDMIGFDAGGGLGIRKKLSEAIPESGLGRKVYDKTKEGLDNFTQRQAAKIGAYNAARKSGGTIKDGLVSTKVANNRMKAKQKADKKSIFGKYGEAYKKGALSIDKNYKTHRDNVVDRFDKKADKNYNMVVDAEAKIKAAKIKTEEKAAKGMTKDGKVLLGEDSNGNIRRKTFEISGPNGTTTTAYVNPQGPKEINTSLGFPTDETSALIRHGENLANNKEGIEINNSGQVIDSSTKKVIAENTYQYACQNLSAEGRAAIQSVVKDNVQRTTSELSATIEQRNNSAATYATAQQQIISIVNSNPNVSEAYAMVEAYDSKKSKVFQIEKTTKSIEEKIEKLKKMEKDLTAEQQKELQNLTVEFEKQNKELEEERKWLDATQEVYESDVNTLKESGIYALKQVVDSNKKIVENCNVEINNIVEKMQKTVDILDDNGNKIGEFNPYNVEINGEILNPIENINKLNTIISVQQKNASKAQEDYEELKKARENSGKEEDK